MSETPDKPVPAPTADTKPFWDAMEEDRLILQRCAACKKVRNYPRPVCDACHSMEADWIEASGKGTLHSWTITHHAFHSGFKFMLPYALLTVDLEEGVRLQAKALGIKDEELRVGLPVKVGFEHIRPGLTLPVIEKA